MYLQKGTMFTFFGPKADISQVLGPLMGANIVIMGSKRVNTFVGQYTMIEKQQFGSLYIQKRPFVHIFWPKKQLLSPLKGPCGIQKAHIGITKGRIQS